MHAVKMVLDEGKCKSKCIPIISTKANISCCPDSSHRVEYVLSCPQVVKLVHCLFVFVALRPMSTAMVIAGRSVHLTTLFPGQA